MKYWRRRRWQILHGLVGRLTALENVLYIYTQWHRIAIYTYIEYRYVIIPLRIYVYPLMPLNTHDHTDTYTYTTHVRVHMPHICAKKTYASSSSSSTRNFCIFYLYVPKEKNKKISRIILYQKQKRKVELFKHNIKRVKLTNIY